MNLLKTLLRGNAIPRRIRKMIFRFFFGISVLAALWILLQTDHVFIPINPALLAKAFSVLPSRSSRTAVDTRLFDTGPNVMAKTPLCDPKSTETRDIGTSITSQEEATQDEIKEPKISQDELIEPKVAEDKISEPKSAGDKVAEPKVPVRNVAEKSVKPRCDNQTLKLKGEIKPNHTAVPVDEIQRRFPEMVEGHYSPKTCTPKEKVAVIIPFRNRFKHLHTLLPHLLPMLMRQAIDFTIFVIEQDLPTTFNKGVVFNAGFLEALKISNFDCFILHDVDLLPLNDHNLYQCDRTSPVHLMGGVNKFRYGLLYDNLIGGVLALTREQYQAVNGFSNLYFGWGGEDDDMHKRVVNRNFTLLRSAAPEGLYDMIRHTRDKRWSANKARHSYGQTAVKRISEDGLNSVAYKVTKVQLKPIFVWINIFVNMTEVFERAPSYMKELNKKVEKLDYETRQKEGTANELDLLNKTSTVVKRLVPVPSNTNSKNNVIKNDRHH